MLSKGSQMEIQRNRVKAAIGVAAVLIAATAIFLWPSKAAVNEASAVKQVSVTRLVSTHIKPALGLPSETVSSSRAVPTPVNYKKIFADSHDYWSFAQQVLPSAKAGDADAQFLLSKALQFCAQANESYFQLNGRLLTLDESLQYAARLKLSMGLVQSMYDRCHAFQEHGATEFGAASDWLEKASEAGQPAAQAMTATEMLQQQQMRNFARAGGQATSDSTAPVLGNGADPTELMRAAVQSGDPEALLSIGSAQSMLNPGTPEGNAEYLAWMLVACERGLDCSANADWVNISCRFCDTSSPVNLVRSRAGNSWPNVQERAQDISSKIDAGQWSDLGLGS